MTTVYAIALALLLAACDSPERSTADQCLRNELFMQCLKAAQHPSLSAVATGEDGDGGIGAVVKQCEDAAYYQSLRKSSTIKPECRA